MSCPTVVPTWHQDALLTILIDLDSVRPSAACTGARLPRRLSMEA
ncbi:hypothetical protein SGUI_0478 [Serinicoccus hydrothermalis]|uniref:Uncharacterized protein n=1 Tax=Serinicoccus hydrothermalis TaxID=1758689 RepID=A0A1B1N8Z1_9MICO|nr:hypothetical protein SGUI_0478 [Serinicoccus hydrothermalis]